MFDPIAPPPSRVDPLSRYVVLIHEVAVDVPPGRWLVQRVCPPGGATLSIRWSGSVVLLDTDPPTEPPALAFTGPITFGGVTACAGALRMLVVFFAAAGAHDLLGIDMRPFVNRSVPAEPILGPLTGGLVAAVADAPAAAERRALVEAALLEMVPLGREPGIGARAAEIIQARSGMSSVESIAADLGTSGRTLRRHFLRQVGIPPKVYARWVRFNHATSYLAGPPIRRWTDAAHRYGYADQAHLVREFRHFAGQPPSHLQGDERLYDPAFVPDVDGKPRMKHPGRFLQDR